MHLSSIYKWCEADDGKASGMWNPLVRLARLTALTGDPRPVEWLCRAAYSPLTNIRARVWTFDPGEAVEEPA